MQWNEMVLSWNAKAPDSTYMKLEVRAIRENGPTKWYTMALWAPDRERFPRESVLQQRDADGNVETDTLILTRPASRLQVRVTLGSADARKASLKFVGIALTDSSVKLPALEPNGAAWGKTLPVPELSQIPYPNGNVICSPTTVSMMMNFWAAELRRPELKRDVPDVAAAVFDTNWKGTGNWAFNMAYCGSYSGMRAYVTRMSDVAELEEWVRAGMPVGLSLCYDLLRGRPSRSSGHLVVCVGFTENGDPVINDPGTSKNVRKIFPRESLVKAWAYSRNAAYLVYPENAEIPTDPYGHWDSWSARQRVRTEKARYK